MNICQILTSVMEAIGFAMIEVLGSTTLLFDVDEFDLLNGDSSRRR